MSQKLYRTPDIYLAAYLRYKGMILQRITMDGKSATFIFQDDQVHRREYTREYYSDEGQMPCHCMKSSILDLKAMIRSSQRKVEVI